MATAAEVRKRHSDGQLMAPDTDRDVLAWWPQRKLDDDDMPTGDIAGGKWVIAYFQCERWNCTELDDQPNAEFWGEDHEWALEPECWQELPPSPDNFVFGAGL
jgi:hypothetical protein